MLKKLFTPFAILFFSFLLSLATLADDPPPPPGGSSGAGGGVGGTDPLRNGGTGAPLDKKTLPLALVLAISAGYGGYLLYRRGKEEQQA